MARRQPKGYQHRPGGKLAYVKVGKEQRTQLFPHGAPQEDIDLWRAQQRQQLKQAQPARGTLAGDIAGFLASLPEGRRKVDFAAWLNKWANSPLGAKPRSTISREDLVKQFNSADWKVLAGSSKNHLRQVLLSLWRELDGPKGHAQCPAREIEKFEESQPRKGFFTEEQITKLTEALSPDYADAIEFFATTGWRSEEVKGLTWSEVDIPHRMIRLSPERAKNREGREFPLGPVEDIINRRLALREARQLEHVFTYQRKRKGVLQTLPVGDWRKAWKTACKAAGCPDAIVHDFRRSAVRTLDKLGVSRSVAMKLVGHKTESIYRRYRIVDEEELHAAGELLRKKA